MRAGLSARSALAAPVEPLAVTLLELVQVIGRATADEREVVATVRRLLRSGRVRLIGNFRDTPGLVLLR